MAYAGQEVEGDVVVVTGGGTGMGAAIARRYAAEGARVALVGRREGPLEEVAQSIGALAIVADAGRAADARRALDLVIERFGRVDTLICNAGGPGFTTVAEATDEEWTRALRANLDTAFVMTREFLPALIDSSGAIVMVSSLSGLVAGPSMAGYVTAKHAVIGLTKSLARDYGSHGVRVNAICPGWVKTPMADEEMDELGMPSREEAYRVATADIPLQRAADPSEIAAAVRFLGSRESSYMTGSTLVIDGGAHIVDVPTIALGNARR